MWPDSSVVRVLARSVRGPGFESKSGHGLFPILRHLVAPSSGCEQQRDFLVGFCYGSKQIRGRIYLSRGGGELLKAYCMA